MTACQSHIWKHLTSSFHRLDRDSSETKHVEFCICYSMHSLELPAYFHIHRQLHFVWHFTVTQTFVHVSCKMDLQAHFISNPTVGHEKLMNGVEVLCCAGRLQSLRRRTVKIDKAPLTCVFIAVDAFDVLWERSRLVAGVFAVTVVQWSWNTAGSRGFPMEDSKWSFTRIWHFPSATPPPLVIWFSDREIERGEQPRLSDRHTSVTQSTRGEASLLSASVLRGLLLRRLDVSPGQPLPSAPLLIKQALSVSKYPVQHSEFSYIRQEWRRQCELANRHRANV